MELIKLTDGELRYGTGFNPSNTKLMLPEFEEWEENGNDDRGKEEGDGSKMHHFVQIFAHDEKKLRLAELAIQAMIREQAEGRKTIRFVIPNLTSGYVIGRGGQNIKKIKDTYTCNIMINQTEGVAEAEVVISGPDEYRIHGAKANKLQESIMRSAERCMRISRDRAELYEKKGEQNEETEENNNKSEWRSGLGLSEDVEKEIAHLRELQLKFEAEPEETYWLDDTAKSPLEPSSKASEALPSSSFESMTNSAQDMDTIDF
ncbi:hypothetical protein WR25_15626 [Diploscapter pachys]|uniref:K Homology domain-containing protein n=1 Tax=Diploscapter pachys TaxID=2018661 RepID=A0A2A2M071_9BILA|nr:hypothetical protein WR25_15626 [Diploscapter pachys]